MRKEKANDELALFREKRRKTMHTQLNFYLQLLLNSRKTLRLHYLYNCQKIDITMRSLSNGGDGLNLARHIYFLVVVKRTNPLYFDDVLNYNHVMINVQYFDIWLVIAYVCIYWHGLKIKFLKKISHNFIL